MKRTALAFAVLVFFGLLANSAYAECTEADIHNAVAAWANVSPDQVKDTTRLDGLGGRSWPEDAPPLIQAITQMCGCAISIQVYETFEYVDDICDSAGVDDLEE